MLSISELIILVAVVILLMIMVLYISKSGNKRNYARDNNYDNYDMMDYRSHTNLDGVRLPNRGLPSPYTGGVAEFIHARYKVIASDEAETEPLSDLCIAGFKNPAYLAGKMNNLPKTSQTFWNTTKSTPKLLGDDIHLEHDAAELQTPEHLVHMRAKTKHFLPFTGGKSRLNFSSFENSNSESPFRQ